MSQNQLSSLCRIAFVVVSIGLYIGCKQQQPANHNSSEAPENGATVPKKEYNPHDAPITEEQKAQLQADTKVLRDAVAKIKELRIATEEETKAGIPENPYQVHQALDKADLVLQWLPQIGRDSGAPKEYWEELNTTANDLRTLFEKVHQNIDEQKNPNFAAVAAEIDQKIARLEAIGQSGSPAEAGK
jgi:hypothetical protein